MRYFLKILNEVKSSGHMKVNGSSGLIYIFRWDVKLRAYTFFPKNQTEVEDLAKTMGRTTSYIFVPVELPASTETLSNSQERVATITLEPEKKILSDANVAHCLARGIIVTDDDDDATAERLIAAYEKGFVQAANARPPRPSRPKKDEDAPLPR